MKIKLSHYNNIKKEIITYLKKYGRKGISEISAMVHIPVIVVYYWYGQEFGFDDDLNDSIKQITEFYGYTEIGE